MESFKSKDAETKMSASMGSFIDHIIKFKYAQNRSEEHWLKELENFMKNFDIWVRVKSKSGFLSYDRLYKGLLHYCSPHFVKNRIYGLKKYNLEYVDVVELSNYLKDYFDEFFKKLSRGEMDIEEFIEKLK